MPILNIKILGSKIEVDYQENEREKLIQLIEQFKKRLSEFESLKGRFGDNKIIFLAALKGEDEIFGLQKKLHDKTNEKNLLPLIDEKIDIKNKEIVKLKDQISFLKKENQKLADQNKITINRFKELNEKLTLLINKIMDVNNNEKEGGAI